MRTLIIRYGRLIRLVITDHPDYRFAKIQEESPVELELFGVTDVKAKDIRWADGVWMELNDKIEQFLSSIIE